MTPIEDPFQAVVESLDPEALSAEFRAQGSFVFLERFLPEPWVEALTTEVRGCADAVRRAWFPTLRKAGTVSRYTLDARAPGLMGLYGSPAFRALLGRIAHVPLMPKVREDAHAAALYWYDRSGDHVGWHYDACGCEDAVSFTATVGLINQTASQLHVQLHSADKARDPEDRFYAMSPGSLVFFAGTRARHRVTPLAEGEERVVCSFAFIREGERLVGWRRLAQNAKDGLLYFGPGALFQKNYR